MSVLLRASFAQKYFRNVSLGQHYEDVLRKCLLEGKVPPRTHFPILGVVLVDDNRNVVHNLIAGADHRIMSSSRTQTYRITYAGCEWGFFVTDHPSQELLSVAEAITRDGRITLLVMHQAQSITVRNIITMLRNARSAETR